MLPKVSFRCQARKGRNCLPYIFPRLSTEQIAVLACSVDDTIKSSSHCHTVTYASRNTLGHFYFSYFLGSFSVNFFQRIQYYLSRISAICLMYISLPFNFLVAVLGNGVNTSQVYSISTGETAKLFWPRSNREGLNEFKEYRA